MNAIQLSILGYVLLQLAIGFLLSRRIHTESDYLLAGRRLGFGIATLTLFATWFGAEACLGAAGAIYQEGFSGSISDPFGYALCLLFMGLFFAVPLWTRNFVTLADFFRVRYSPVVERLAAVLIIPSSLVWASSQMRAFGQVIASFSPLSPEQAITLSAVVVVIYTISGGLWADAVTDVIQGIMLVVGLICLLVAVLSHTTPEHYTVALTAERLDFFRNGSLLQTLEAWLIPICGSMLSQELVARALAARSPQVAKRSALVASGLYFLIGSIPAFIGLVGIALFPNLSDPESLLPVAAKAYLPPWLYVIFIGALFSAILSTVDSALLATSALFSHNLIIPLFPKMSEESKVRTNRLGVALFGAIAYSVALYAGSVHELVILASAISGAGIFTVVVIGLFTPFGKVRSAVATLIAGSLVWALATFVLHLDFAYTLALVVSFLTYFLFALFETPRLFLPKNLLRHIRSHRERFIIPTMEHAIRKEFNQKFRREVYEAFIADISRYNKGAMDFRLCETPLFLSEAMTTDLMKAAHTIVDELLEPSLMKKLDQAVPKHLYVPNEDAHPTFLQLDFAIAEMPDGTLAPRLIELQGFPTLYAFQWLLDKKIRQFFDIPDSLTPYFSGYSSESYLQRFRELLLGNSAPENVVLLEVQPETQKTRIDFYCTEELTGIKTICLTEVIKRQNRLYYKQNGKEIPIERIYNRVVFDELYKKQIEFGFRFQDELDVVWLNHPNWFMKISKYCLPLFKSQYVPKAYLLSDLERYPTDLENYVLKPLFSFSGTGVEIDVTPEMLDRIADRQNYLLQEKVKYAPLVDTPEGGTKAEVRMMFFWGNSEKPELVNNLVRMSRGKMLGASYNKNAEWIGASLAYHP
ncbi:MAG: sodium:solute symporter family protein [Chloroherpetonaceae bacterium]|nr:sodium:solute symporter family protein [Chloroherpetonaceae bacterium]